MTRMVRMVCVAVFMSALGACATQPADAVDENAAMAAGKPSESQKSGKGGRRLENPPLTMFVFDRAGRNGSANGPKGYSFSFLLFDDR